MKVVNIQAAKTHLSRLVEEAARGEDIVLAKAGRPIVRLTPYRVSGRRTLGCLKGRIVEKAGCWDGDALIEAQFSEGELLPAHAPEKKD